MAGPSSSCKDYEESALSKDDVNNIVNKINEGRNFVANGLSRLLPEAANMNKIYWSDELAAFAQRWVDQCDSSTRPDKEDECRDLDDGPVGQNIVSVLGPAPGLRLTSLIDVWFMQKRDYMASVSYYNQTSDWKTNHFTQLIWAETDKIGCGRARFYVDQKNAIIERLVCNFSPKGNIHGKPVYAIGFPATQCQKNKVPDNHFHGLCANLISHSVRPSITTTRPVSSLLKILNLSNNSVKFEIDPIRNNLLQTNLNGNDTLGQRNPKTRHVFFNNSLAGLRNIAPPPIIQNQWNTPANPYSPNSRGQRFQHHQPERGHSRVYHGHDSHDSKSSNPTENYRKFDYTAEQASTLPSTDFRKYNGDQCTRRSWTEETKCESSHQPNPCTRRHAITSCPHLRPIGNSCPILNANLGLQKQLCECNTPRITCATMPPKCPCNVNCQCFNSDPNVQCQSGRRMQDTDNDPTFAVAQSAKKDETRKSAELHYYDLLPNMEIRSGDGEEAKLPSAENFRLSSKDTWLQQETTIPDMLYKRFSHKIRPDHRQVKGTFEGKTKFKQEHDYMFDSSDFRVRERRSPDDKVTLKPFWQLDDNGYRRDKPALLKALRYTTLLNRRKKNRQNVRISQTTESITFKLRDTYDIKSNRKSLSTEKYLSFDELMHLRKVSNVADTEIDARRNKDAERTAATTTHHAPAATTHHAAAATTHHAAAATTHHAPAATTHHAAAATTKHTAAATTKHTAAATTKHTAAATTHHAATVKATTKATTKATVETTEYTANTPFQRKKVCTRKITCTWTEKTIIGADGSIIKPGSGGSRTPPGYVEGCTRTSTCTRDFLNRNKFSTTLGMNETDLDEDYCEKRALNIRRRDSNSDFNAQAYTDVTVTLQAVHSYVNTKSDFISSTNPTTSVDSDDCLCYEEIPRLKRDDNNVYSRVIRSKRSEDNMSYGDLYYLILQKILKTWKGRQNSLRHDTTCLCNSAIVFQGSISIMLFIILYNLINVFI